MISESFLQEMSQPFLTANKSEVSSGVWPSFAAPFSLPIFCSEVNKIGMAAADFAANSAETETLKLPPIKLLIEKRYEPSVANARTPASRLRV